MFKGHGEYNDAAPLVSEFIDRTRLAKLGFQASEEDLEVWEVEAVVAIGAEFERLEAEETAKRSKARGSGRRR